MADSTTDQLLPASSIDDLIEQSLGGFGFTQLIQVILISLPLFFDGQQAFISIYTDAMPTWHCTNTNDTTYCNLGSNICDLPDSAWAWDRPSYQTIISEWGLQCASSIITSLPSASFYVGCLIGGFILAPAGDSLIGRKKLLFLSCLTMSLAAFATQFSTNLWIYSSFRFLSGFGRASIITSALVLLVEMVGKKWRGQVGIIGLFGFTLGLLCLPTIAYANRDSSWRNLYLWTSIPGILYSTTAYFFVNESPRWLFMQGRGDEAVIVLKKLSSRNDVTNIYYSTLSSKPIEDQTADFYSSAKNLFGRNWALQRILAAAALGFGVGMVYYGMLLGVGSLGFNIYLSTIFNALLEIPSYFVSFILIGKFNRKVCILGFTMVSGISSILCGVVGDGHKGLEIGMELASFFCACVAFNVVLIYSTELFPTSVRNLAASMVRQAIILGAVFSPMLIAAGSDDNDLLCYGVFGGVIILCGLFVIWLPETRGLTLCDTIDEQEQQMVVNNP